MPRIVLYSSVGKNKIMNNENEAMVEKYLTKQKYRKTEDEKFSQKGLQMGLMNQGELPPRRMEKAWDSDVNMEHT